MTTRRGHAVRQLLAIGLAGTPVSLCAGTSEGADKARRAPVANQCEATWRAAESRSEAGQLREARTLFAECAKASCAAYAKQCGAKANQLELDIPTVVPLATDDTGAPLVNVQVKADGELVTLRLDGRALPIDPGLHELSFSTWDHGVFATEKIMVIEGQRNRPITVSFHKPGGAPPVATDAAAVAATAGATTDDAAAGGKASDSSAGASAPTSPAATSSTGTEPLPKKSHGSALPWIVGGVGLASIGAGALMTYWGNKDNAALASCSPNCAAADLTHIRTLYLASDVSFGAGAAALGLAGVLWLTGRHSSDDGVHPSVGLEVQPTPSGAFASLKGRF